MFPLSEAMLVKPTNFWLIYSKRWTTENFNRPLLCSLCLEQQRPPFPMQSFSNIDFCERHTYFRDKNRPKETRNGPLFVYFPKQFSSVCLSAFLPTPKCLNFGLHSSPLFTDRVDNFAQSLPQQQRTKTFLCCIRPPSLVQCDQIWPNFATLA